MNQKLKENLIPLAVAIGLGGLIMWAGASCASLDPDNWVKVSVPEAVRDPGQMKQLPLGEAKSDYKIKAAKYQESMGVYAANIEGGTQRAESIRGFFEFLNAKIVQVGEVAVPGWSALGLTSGVGLLAGALGIKKPGTLTQKEGDDLYDAGRREERESILAAGTKTA